MLIVPYTRRRRAEQLLTAANLRATWSPPPSAEEIRAKDQERLLARARAREPSCRPRSVAAAQALLAGRDAEAIAAALVRRHRAELPAPEELLEQAPEPPARARTRRDRARSRPAAGRRRRGLVPHERRPRRATPTRAG